MNKIGVDQITADIGTISRLPGLGKKKKKKTSSYGCGQNTHQRRSVSRRLVRGSVQGGSHSGLLRNLAERDGITSMLLGLAFYMRLGDPNLDSHTWK